MNTIYAWGYGDVLVNILQGLASLFASGGYMVGLGKLVLLLGIIFTLLAYFSDYGQRDPLRIFKFYVLTIGVWSLFIQVKTTVQVNDLQLNRVQVVQNVPYVIGKPLALFSQVQKSLLGAVDMAFGLPDGCGSSQSGVLTCPGTTLSALRFRIQDPYLSMSFNQFIQNCVYTDILDGSLDLNTLMTSDNLMLLMGYGRHPARYTKVYANAECQFTESGCSPCKGGCSMSCPDAWGYISGRIQSYIQSSSVRDLAGINGMAQTQLSQILGVAPSYLLGISQTSLSFLSQAIAINHLGDAYTRWAEANLAPGLGYSLGVAERTLEQQGITNQVLMGKYLPALKGVIITLLVGSLPALFLLMLTPVAVKTLIGYITMFVWVLFWTFGEGILNAIMMVKMRGDSSYIGSLNAYTINMYANNLSEYIAMAGQFYNYIPILSFLLVSGFSLYAMKGMASGTIGSITSAGASPAVESAKASPAAGNPSFGNQSWSNVSFGNISGWGRSMFNTSFDTISAFRGEVGFTGFRGPMKDIKGGSLSSADFSAMFGRAVGLNDYKGSQAVRAVLSMMSMAGVDRAMVHSLTRDGDGRIRTMDVSVGNRRLTYDADKGNMVVEIGGSRVNFDYKLEDPQTGKGQFMAVGQIGSEASLSGIQNYIKDIQTAVSDTKEAGKAFEEAVSAKDETALRNAIQKFTTTLQKTGTMGSFIAGFLSSVSDKEAYSMLTSVLQSEGVRKDQWKELKAEEAREKMAKASAKVSVGKGGLPGWSMGIEAEVAYISRGGESVVVGTKDGKFYELTLSKQAQQQLATEIVKTARQERLSQSYSGSERSTGTTRSETEEHTRARTYMAAQKSLAQSFQSYQESIMEKYGRGVSYNEPLLTAYAGARKEYYMKQGMEEGNALALAIQDAERLKFALSDPSKRGEALKELAGVPLERFMQIEGRLSELPNTIQNSYNNLEERVRKKTEENPVGKKEPKPNESNPQSSSNPSSPSKPKPSPRPSQQPTRVGQPEQPPVPNLPSNPAMWTQRGTKQQVLNWLASADKQIKGYSPLNAREQQMLNEMKNRSPGKTIFGHVGNVFTEVGKDAWRVGGGLMGGGSGSPVRQKWLEKNQQKKD